MQTSTKIIFLITLFLGSCHRLDVISESVSGIDQRFRLDQIKTKSSDPVVQSSFIDFYKSSVNDVVGNNCQMFPSDSAQARLSLQTCGPMISLLREVDRVYLEPAADELGLAMFSTQRGFFYVDFPNNCTLY